MTRYYRAEHPELGTTHLRSTLNGEYTHAAVWQGVATFHSRADLAAKSAAERWAKQPGKVVEAVEIDAATFRQLQAAKRPVKTTDQKIAQVIRRIEGAQRDQQWDGRAILGRRMWLLGYEPAAIKAEGLVGWGAKSDDRDVLASEIEFFEDRQAKAGRTIELGLRELAKLQRETA